MYSKCVLANWICLAESLKMVGKCYFKLCMYNYVVAANHAVYFIHNNAVSASHVLSVTTVEPYVG